MHAAEPTKMPVLAALCHELLNREEFATIADLADALKMRAARLRIPYDAARIAEALERVHYARPLLTRSR